MQYRVIHLFWNGEGVIADGKESKKLLLETADRSLENSMAYILNVLERDGWKPIHISSISNVSGNSEDIGTLESIYIVVAKESDAHGNSVITTPSQQLSDSPPQVGLASEPQRPRFRLRLRTENP